MTIYSLRLFKKNNFNGNLLLCYAEDLSSFPFFARISNSASEFLLFTSRTLADKTLESNFVKYIEGDYAIYVHSRLDGLIPVLITDKSYPERVGFEVLSKMVKLFKNEEYNWDWSMWEEDVKDNHNSLIRSSLQKLLEDYSTLDKEDRLLKVSSQLNETKVVMTESVNKILERGEHIDELVYKSKDLSNRSKDFYKNSKKMNSWCGNCNVM